MKGHYFQGYVLSLVVFLFGVLSLLPAILSPISLVFTLPLVFAPAVFTMVAAIGGFTNEKDFNLSNVNIWIFFRRYYTNRFFGCFRMIRNLFRGFLVYVLIAFIAFLALGNFGESFWPGLTEALNQLYFLSQNTSASDVISYINSSDVLLNFLLYVQGIAILFGSFSFFHGLFFYIPNAYLRTAVSVSSSRLGFALFSSTIRENRSRYFKLGISIGWPFIPLFLGGYIGGFALGVNLTNQSSLVFFIALCGALLGICLYIPFYGAGLPYLFGEMQIYFMQHSLDAAKKAMEDLKKQDVSQEDIDTMNHCIDDFENSLEKAKEEKKDGEVPSINEDDSNSDKE